MNAQAHDKYKYRVATSADCGDIMRLVRELAEFERAPDGVKITDKVLQRDGFGELYVFSITNEHQFTVTQAIVLCCLS